MIKVVGIIPARYASTRFPGKPLADIAGMSMIHRVILQAKKSTLLSSVVVATDDLRIADHISALGEQVVMTSEHHASGTDRCLEALEKTGLSADAVLNIQGDEPFVDPEQIDTLVRCISDEQVEIATLAKKITESEVLFDPNKVKVIFSERGRAIYFSRHAIPFQKSVDQKEWMNEFNYHKHIGLYAYKVKVLKEICALPPSPLELAESLEQLRWMEAGKSIYVRVTDIETPAIDTPEDLKFVLQRWKFDE